MRCLSSSISFNSMLKHSPLICVEQVSNDTKYWNWLVNVFLPGVFAGKWCNNQKENHTTYIGDKRSVLVGMPRARQLRVESSKF